MLGQVETTWHKSPDRVLEKGIHWIVIINIVLFLSRWQKYWSFLSKLFQVPVTVDHRDTFLQHWGHCHFHSCSWHGTKQFDHENLKWTICHFTVKCSRNLIVEIFMIMHNVYTKRYLLFYCCSCWNSVLLYLSVYVYSGFMILVNVQEFLSHILQVSNITNTYFSVPTLHHRVAWKIFWL